MRVAVAQRLSIDTENAQAYTHMHRQWHGVHMYVQNIYIYFSHPSKPPVASTLFLLCVLSFSFFALSNLQIHRADAKRD